MEDNGSTRRGYVIFAWTPRGYQLRERDGDLPAVGAEIQDDGRVLSVTKIGPSPFPGDARPCVYTVGTR